MLIDPYRHAPVDPDFGDVVLLLQIDSNGVMVDNSLVAQSISIVGGGEVNSDVELFGSPTFDNPGTSVQGINYVVATAPPGTYQFAGEFTFEGWFYIDAVTDAFNNYFSNNVGFPLVTYYQIYFTAGGTGVNSVASAGSSISFLTATPPPVGAMHHYALTRDALNIVRIFVDGVQVGPDYGPYTGALGGSDVTELRIGAGNSTVPDNGDSNFHFAEIRVTKQCRYTTDFNPPIGPF